MGADDLAFAELVLVDLAAVDDPELTPITTTTASSVTAMAPSRERTFDMKTLLPRDND